MKRLLAALCLLLPTIHCDQARAEKRVALVVGNSAYQYTGKLANPRNDAADIAVALKKHGFLVIEGFDLGKTEFERKVRDFSAELRGADVGVFFYAGHGLQVEGHNYLVPVDAKAETADALDWEMLRLGLIHRTMERAANTNIIFLDACRDNPLARNLARSMGTRSADVGRGLAPVEGGVGTLISFSTQPGNVALDGSGRNSPFAAALARQLLETKDDLSAVLIAVRNEVMKQTQRKQVPWEHSALTGRFFFSPPAPVAEAGPSEAAQAWALVKDSSTAAVLEAFEKQFDNTVYGALARDKLVQLRKAEDARKADEARKVEEVRRLEAAKKAEEARAREEGERQRVAMLQQEEKQRAAALAAAAEEASKAKALTLARNLQKELRRLGCEPGNVDGKWDDRAKKALNDFVRLTKSTIPQDAPSEEALKAVLLLQDRICPLRCAADQKPVGNTCVQYVKPTPSKQQADTPSSAPKQGSGADTKGGTCYGSNALRNLVPCSSSDSSGQRAF